MSFLAGFKQRLTDGLRRSQEFLTAELKTVFEPERPIDEALFEELEEVLIAADLGAAIAADFKHRAKEEVMFGTVTRADQLRPLFRKFLVDTLSAKAHAGITAVEGKDMSGVTVATMRRSMSFPVRPACASAASQPGIARSETRTAGS